MVIWQGQSNGHDEVISELTELTNATTSLPEAPSSLLASSSVSPELEPPELSPSTSEAESVPPVAKSFTIVETIPHDAGAFTQGLEIYNGRLFESTGLVGRSSIREIDLASGTIVRNEPVPEVFAEGLTLVGADALQLTWKAGIAYRYDTNTFAVTDTYTYDGEGWGLCYNDSQLVMSNGSATLQFRDPETFALRSTIDVELEGIPVQQLNELECVDGSVWANIWKSTLIVEIDPTSGDVTGVLDAAALVPEAVAGDSSAVLNGIAYDDETGTFLLTGKLWPVIYRVTVHTEQ